MITGIFGGTFDPVHQGHLNLARQLLARRVVHRVVFVPAAIPPHKRDGSVAAGRHRLRMLQAATAEDPGLDVSVFELARARVSYTITTARWFGRRLGPAHMRLVIGGDSLLDLPHWFRAAELVRSFRFVVYRRPGCALPARRRLAAALGRRPAEALLAAVVQAPQRDISATDIRRRVARGASVAELVPPAVRDYIHNHGLYR